MDYTAEQIIQIVTEQHKESEFGKLDLNKPLVDQGYDSLDALELILNIEKALEISIKDQDIHKDITAMDIVSLCMNEMGFKHISI